MLYFSHAKAAKPDDAGTQKGSGLQIVNPVRQWKRKISSRDRILSVAAIHAVTSEGRSIAKVFQFMAAIPAASIYAANPGDAHPIPCRKISRAWIGNFSHDLVAGNYFIAAWRQFAFHNVQVRSTNAAGAHTQKNMAGLELWPRDLADLERVLRNISWRRENGSFHLHIVKPGIGARFYASGSVLRFLPIIDRLLLRLRGMRNR